LFEDRFCAKTPICAGGGQQFASVAEGWRLRRRTSELMPIHLLVHCNIEISNAW
jgi:hypothetical protein